MASTSYTPMKKLPHWRVLNRGSGCLLLQCSTRGAAGYSHLITLNFSGFEDSGYLYEEGTQYVPLTKNDKFSKEEALKILSTLNVTDLSHAWLLVSSESVPIRDDKMFETLNHNIDDVL